MKQYRIPALFFAASIALGGMISCSTADDAISDLKGIYSAPVDLTITGANVADKAKDGAIRTYTVDFTTAQGDAVHLVLVSNQYYLTANGYTYADAAVAKNGNFTTGSTINGAAVTDGTFALAKDGDNYVITRCSLFTSEGKAYRLTGKAVMSFEPDDPTAITVKPSYGMDGTPSLYVDNGDGTVTVTFTTGGYTENLNMTTYQMEYAGEGNDLQVIFKLKDGKLTPGTYAPGTGYVAGYTFMNNSFEAFGVPAFPDYGGTLWYTIAGGVKTPMMVEAGDIVVTKAGPIYTILLDQGKGGVYAQFTGTLGDLDPDGTSGNVMMLDSFTGAFNLAQMGWDKSIILYFSAGDVTSSTDEQGVTTYTGSGTLFQIQVYSEDGTLVRGDYDVAVGGGEGKVVAGNNGPMGDGGVFTREVKDGQPGEAQFITEGLLTVDGQGDDTTLTFKSGDVTYMFKGNIGL